MKKEFIKNAIAVSAVSLVMSGVGVLFRTYASNRVGSEVMGLLQLIMSVYLPACTLASSGVYVASTRLCAEAIAKKNQAVRVILNRCIIYGLFFGISAFLLLFFGAKTIANQWLSYPNAEIPLKILAFGLPFLSMSNALQGFFLSLRKATYSTVLQVTEDLSKIAATVTLFFFYSENGPHAALCALVAGMAIGETVSCVIGYLLYRRKTNSSAHTPSNQPEIFREIIKIALPCAFSGYLRSGIGMIEGILVPKGLQNFGLTAEQTLAALGKFEGMTLPILTFPATFLAVVSKLLVPEITAEHAVGNDTNNIKTIYTTLKWTLAYGIFLAVFVGLFGKNLGMEIYRDETCGFYLTLLAPLVPILYADKVVDGIMKGYNRQMTTMKINLADSVLQTFGAWILIPHTGIGGYIALFCFGTVFNFSLSLYNLRKTCKLRFPFKEGVLEPLFFALGATLPIKLLQKTLPHSVWVSAGLSILLFLLFKTRDRRNKRIRS